MKDNMKKYQYNSSKAAEAIILLHGVCGNERHMEQEASPNLIYKEYIL